MAILGKTQQQKSNFLLQFILFTKLMNSKKSQCPDVDRKLVLADEIRLPRSKNGVPVMLITDMSPVCSRWHQAHE